MSRRKLRQIVWYLLIFSLCGFGAYALVVDVSPIIVWLLFSIPLSWLVYLLIVRYPEITFALFLTAGVYAWQAPNTPLHLAAVLGVLSTIGVLHRMLIKREITPFVPPLRILVPYLGILLLSFLSLAYTPSPLYGVNKLLKLCTTTTLAFLLPFYLFRREKAIDRFFIAYVFIALVMFIDILINGLEPGKLERRAAFGSDYITSARVWSNAAVILFFYLLPKSRNTLEKVLCILASGAVLFSLFASGTRGPAIATIVALLVALALHIGKASSEMLNYSRIKRADLSILLSVLVFLILSVVLFFFFHEYFVAFFYRLFLLAEGGERSALERLSRYSAAFNVMKSFPSSLLGLGIGGFQTYYHGFDTVNGDYPHNILLEVGAELGLIGLALFLSFVFLTFREAFYILKKSEAPKTYLLDFVLFGLFLNMLVNSLLSGDINDNRLVFTWASMIFSVRGMLKNEEA